ncbi:dTDP-4-dehydrorhamnose reductase [Ovoidimarina sediminis]|uniref:dTDP-4-dehydrorhamnose reductase n=1 Tax=Ovoidimarina sediminis TaxID=3079856 RepID=UPI00290D92D6|nr:dTDP-4-dehydrorhamnose reductase [Rhodophyticola sp. MJ-SS7]MDU8943266.1 dTDP-4-dehydrorhamnose reductase [Rhodophyticola sp. MJ-SS7]
MSVFDRREALLVFGGTGQVGRALIRADASVVAPARGVADLTEASSVSAVVERLRPRAIINAAAWTAVDAAEDEEDAAFAVNALGAGHIAKAAAAHGVPLVLISTDYVFDGQGMAPWRPEDTVSPLGAYGRTKCAAEERVRDAGGAHAILRTSWVFSPDGVNFVKSMLRLSETRESLTIVSDQVGGPTAAADIAGACLAIADQLAADPGKTGTYHYSGAPDVSWADFARVIFAMAGRSTEVTDIPSTDYPTPAERPKNSRLDCSTTEDVFGLARPDWRGALGSVLEELGIERQDREEAGT